jgi:hypothetical protein
MCEALGFTVSPEKTNKQKNPKQNNNKTNTALGSANLLAV